MSTIALIDTRLKIPGESIGTVVSNPASASRAAKNWSNESPNEDPAAQAYWF